MAMRTARAKYPTDELDRLWKIVLLNQFHDILPGSSIGLVYEDSKKQYAELIESAKELRESAMKALGSAKPQAAVPVNTVGFDRSEVATNKGKLVYVEAPSYGIGQVVKAPDEVTVTQTGKNIVLENANLKAIFSSTGRLTSLIEKSTGREVLAGDGNCLEMYDDRPTAWDAWDVDPFHLETGRKCGPSRDMKVVTRDRLRAEVQFNYTCGAESSIRQIVRLDANSARLEFHCEADWRESNKFLKVGFPVNVRAMNATYEMQFGAVERPTHFNTAADLARYEVPGHRWADLCEHGFGVALLSESKYGFSTLGNEMRISLLRAPKYPDEQADIGKHQFAYAIYPHAGDWRSGGVVAEGFRFNVPILFAPRLSEPMSFASVDDPNLVLDTIKKAEDGDGIVLRLYECHGARGKARVKLGFGVKSARLCNALEDEAEALKVKDGAVELEYAPFQIISVIVK
jgi:alpha-mannosidase